MKKKPFIFIASLVLSIIFTTTAVLPIDVSAATTAKKATTSVKKSSKKKKKTVRRKLVDLNPPLITLATAPHSPKPVSRRTSSKKKKTKKKLA